MKFPFPTTQIPACQDDAGGVLLPIRIQASLRRYLSIVSYPIGLTVFVPAGEGR
jgi:hypothetical protein